MVPVIVVAVEGGGGCFLLSVGLSHYSMPYL